MKRLITILTTILFNANLFAQAPQKMSYQMVIRNNTNQLITNHNVGIQITIVQGSPTGTTVYTETQTPLSNANGLVSIEIGGGAGFNTINWANGPYYLSVATDPNGGSSYTVVGISQLLSVPYALHAQTANSIAGGQNENDPIFTSSPAHGITATDTINWNLAYGWGNHSAAGYLKSFTETDPIFGASVAHGITSSDTTRWNHKQDTVIAGTGIKISNNVVSARTYRIGEFVHGGIVFWLDESGQHGLVCAKFDQSSSIRWHAGANGNTQAKGNGPYAGKKNTATIIAAQVAIGDDGATYAARICNESQITENGRMYGDWYLPSLDELSQMYQNKTIIDSVALANGGSAFSVASGVYCAYWTSTETNSSTAWIVYFNNGYQFNGRGKVETTPRVRAVRAF